MSHLYKRVMSHLDTGDGKSRFSEETNKIYIGKEETRFMSHLYKRVMSHLDTGDGEPRSGEENQKIRTSEEEIRVTTHTYKLFLEKLFHTYARVISHI